MTPSLRLPLWILTLFLCLLQTGWGAWQYSGTTPDGDFTYSATYDQTAGGAYEGTASISGYTGSATNVVIPSSVSFDASPSGQNVAVTCSVTAIQSNWGQMGSFADKAFITSVSIPSSITVIGDNSFFGCTGMSEISIPSSVISIGGSAFFGCSELVALYLHEGLASIEKEAFSGCTKLNHIFIPSSVRYMGYVLFNGYNGPFTNCVNLTEVSIGRGANLGKGAFKGLKNLSNVTFTGLSDPLNPGAIGDSAFHGCTSLTNIIIPEGVNTIGQAAFMDCSGLHSVTIPSTITAWGDGAFVNCASLNSVTLQPGLKSIGTSAFVLCNSLEKIIIPYGVTSISYCAFSYCANLTSIDIPRSVTRIEEGGLSGCGKLPNITIPESVTNIDNSAFADCPLLDNVVIPSSVTSLGGFAFLRCTGLKDITLSENMTSIGERTFYGCTGLSSVSIPSNVTSIGDLAFYDCPNLKCALYLGNAPTMGSNSFLGRPVTCYYLPGASGFTSPTWQGYPCFIAAPYGGVIPNLPTNEAHLIGGAPSDGNVRLEAAVTDAPLLWQRQNTTVTLDMETSRILRLGATGTVRIETGYGGLAIGRSAGDGFLTAGGSPNTPGTLILDNASTNDLTIHSVIANNGGGVVGLGKTGGGRAVLGAMNTYSGNTTITGGTLVLKSPCLAGASAVTITAGSTLNLDYTGADIVSSLTLNGTTQPNGLYDSTNTNGLITGTGKIQVGPFADFTAWAAAIAPGQTADQDHDLDGVPNGVEYFMGTSGSGFTTNPALINGTIIWPKSPAFTGSYQIQTSTDLSNWTDVTNDPAQVTQTTDSVIWTQPAGPGNRFVRLLVTPN